MLDGLSEAAEDNNATIKVIGVGGAGGNAIANMVAANLDGVEFIVANTDAQALERVNIDTKVQIGTNITGGLGAGADPEVGRQAAEEDRARIRAMTEGADMVFITAGMGGGTGTGAAPVFAQEAREQGILTVGVATRPFPFEGKRRLRQAEAGVEALAKHVDSAITIPNEKLLGIMGRKASLLDAFKRADDVLLNSVQGISELITRPGLINVDFADVRTVMSEMGMAVMGSASATGEDRAESAAHYAVSSPLLEDMDLTGAQGVLVNVTAGMDMAISEYQDVGNIMRGFASEEADVVMGTVLDPELEDEIRVTVVATGLSRGESKTAADERPAGETNRGQGQSKGGESARATVERHRSAPQPDEDLDVPAFLRKQAD